MRLLVSGAGQRTARLPITLNQYWTQPMNVNDLIGADPGLLQNLMDLGFSYAQVDDLGLEVGAQLAETTGHDLGELLGRLNSASFLMRLDIPPLADKLGTDVPTMQAALLLLASAITMFAGDEQRPSTLNDPHEIE
ncbi:MAG: hypothetical protein OES38_03660 [Gammaproteobacteria bacterium]|nr:hypothetical protein [Gammaproteobacteria bacterium]